MAKFPATYIPGFHDAVAVLKMKYNNFGQTGMQVSELSLGAAGFSTIYGDCSLEECKATILEAIKSGINYIDTAYWYGQGQSETMLGQCLKDIPREAYYIATKVGRYENDPKLMFDYTAEKTRTMINSSLEKLGLNYVDVLQIHDIEFAPSLEYLFKETLPVLQEAKDAGKTKFIGITGYPVLPLVKFISLSTIKIDSVLSYARYTIIDSTLKSHLDQFQGLGIGNAAIVAMGLLTNDGPQLWHPASEHIKLICEEARNYCKDNNVDLAKLAMHFVIRDPVGHTLLCGMNNRKILKHNLDVYYNGITEFEEKILNYLLNNIFSKLHMHSLEVHWEGMEKAEK